MELIDRIILVIKDAGINDKTFCERVNFKQNRFSNYKQGLGKIPADLIISTVQEFGVSSEWLLTGKGDMYPSSVSGEDLENRVKELERVMIQVKEQLKIV